MSAVNGFLTQVSFLNSPQVWKEKYLWSADNKLVFIFIVISSIGNTPDFMASIPCISVCV